MGRPGLTMFTAGSRLEYGASGYASPGRRVPPGRPQDPHGLGPGGIRRRVRSDCDGNEGPRVRTVTIFTDVQAAIWKMTSATQVQARNTRPWPESTSPPFAPRNRVMQGIEGNEIADQWAKQAADEPDAHGVEWLDFKDPAGIVRKGRLLLPISPRNFKRDFAERK